MGHVIDQVGRPRRYLAHSANDDGAGVPEPLRQHLQAVADRAASFGQTFGADEQARAAGLVHDLGKYADQFRRRLKNPREPSRDHWSAGAALIAGIGKELGLISVVTVAGHHAGPVWSLCWCGRGPCAGGFDSLNTKGYVHLFTYRLFAAVGHFTRMERASAPQTPASRVPRPPE